MSFRYRYLKGPFSTNISNRHNYFIELYTDENDKIFFFGDLSVNLYHHSNKPMRVPDL